MRRTTMLVAAGLLAMAGPALAEEPVEMHPQAVENDATGVLGLDQAWFTSVQGRLVSVSRAAGTVTLLRDRREVVLPLEKDARVTIGGRVARLDQLQPGQRVIVEVEREGQQARAAWISARKMG